MSASFSRWFTRRAIMQGVLLVIAAGVFVVAIIVQNRAADTMSVELGPPQQVGPFSVPSPAGWAVRRTENGVIFTEPVSRGGRIIEFHRTTSLMFRSPIERLLMYGVMLPGDSENRRRSVAIGGVHPHFWPLPAVWVYGEDADPHRNGARAARRGDAYACAVTGISDAVMLGLTDRRRELASNRRLAWGILSGIRCVEQPPVVARNVEFRLAYDTFVRVSAPCMADRPDSLSISRMFVLDDRMFWRAAELVPCVVPPGTAEQFLLETFRLRNPVIAPLKLEQADAGTWVCWAEHRPTMLAIYLHRHSDGRALLADIRCDYRDPVPTELVRQAWSLCRDIGFGDGFPMQQAFDAGRQCCDRLMPDIERWAVDREGETRWQTYHDSSPRSAIMLCLRGRSGDFIEGEERWERPPSPAVEGALRRWRMSADGTSYHCEVSSAYDGAVRRCIFDARRINGEWRLAEAAAGAAPATRLAESPRENFVPGALLPVFLGRAPYERMVLTTESLPEPTTGILAGPFVLLVEPAFDAPRHLPAEVEPMRCWAVNVGGTGWSSRWYYDGDGRLRAITYPGGRHMHIMTTDAPSTVPAAQ